jgi:hypothetical protein
MIKVPKSVTGANDQNTNAKHSATVASHASHSVRNVSAHSPHVVATTENPRCNKIAGFRVALRRGLLKINGKRAMQVN